MNSFLENHEWARDPAFNHFWRHYEICDQWRRHHIEVKQQVQMLQFDGTSNRDEFGDVQEPEVTERLSRCEIRSEVQNEGTEVEEMSEEMKQFFAKTQEHRQKLKEKRKAEQRKEEGNKHGKQEDYVNVEKISVHGRVEHSSDHRDANAEFIEKREKAKENYGEAAPKILAMESAMEMKFETEYAKNPHLWPNIPFRF